MMNFTKWPMALVAGLLGACQAFAGPPALPSLAPPQPLPVIGSGAWVSQDEWRGLLHIHQLPPAQTVSLRLPGWLAVDLNTTAQVLCGAGADRLMRVSLPDQRGLQAGFSVEPGGPAPGVAASRSGVCASPGGDTRLLWLDADGTPRTVALRLPPGMARFDWQDLAYDDEQDVFIATGRQGFALIPASRHAPQARVIGFEGTLNDRVLGPVRASQLRWCGAFFRQAQRLVCLAQLGDASLNAIAALVLIDPRQGRLRKVLLPTASGTSNTSTADDADASLEQIEASMPMARLWRQGPVFQVLGQAPTADGSPSPVWLRMHAGTGALSSGPARRPPIADLVGLVQPFGVALWHTEQNTTQATDVRDGQILHRHPGRVVAMAHGRPPASPPSGQRPEWPQGPLPIRMDQLEATIGLSGLLPALTQVVARSSTLDDLRARVQAISLSTKPAAHHPPLTWTLQDASTHVLRVSRLDAPQTRPAWQGQDSDPADWRRFKEACQQQADTTAHAELTHLQCVLQAL